MTLTPLPEFAGSNVLITGASGGLGAAAARYFSAAGANLALADLRRDGLNATTSELEGPGRTESFTVDVSDPASVSTLVESALRALGSVDVLLNIAGILGPIATTEEYPADAFEKVLRVNAFGTYLVTKAVLPAMRENGGGAIVNVSSVSAVRGVANEIGYGASKAAVTQITRNVALEYAAHRVRINAVAPGWIDTDMMSELSAARSGTDTRDNVARYGVSGRAAQPSEIVEAMAFLASPRASYINGTILTVDGGMTVC
ncbi:SDR family oxidoreductase [Mycetocola sp. 2940]|uniref:SDR family NAD(P)-dependent oxidoreductase n=1 Tax=Mycetocola sp. 2940 TaxID=3156452 RepID=UPI003393C2EB